MGHHCACPASKRESDRSVSTEASNGVVTLAAVGRCHLTRGWSGPARDQLASADSRWVPAAQPQGVRRTKHQSRSLARARSKRCARSNCAFDGGLGSH